MIVLLIITALLMIGHSQYWDTACSPMSEHWYRCRSQGGGCADSLVNGGTGICAD